MVDTIVFRFKWLPKEIGSFFIDDLDYRGLVYWYERIESEQKEINRLRKGIKK